MTDAAPNEVSPAPVSVDGLYTTHVIAQLPVCTRVNAIEAYPDVVYPLESTAVTLRWDHGIRATFRDLGLMTIDPPGFLVNRVFRGRVYINFSWSMWLGDALPGADAAGMEQATFGQPLGVEIPRPPISRAQRLIRAPLVARTIVRHVQAVRHAQARLDGYLAERRSLDWPALTDAQLAVELERIAGVLEVAVAWHSRVTIAAMTMIGTLSKAIVKSVGELDMSLLVTALGDLGEVESAMPARRLDEIATRARAAHPELAAALIAGTDTWAVLAEHAPETERELRELIERYGYRGSSSEVKLSTPSWADDPAPVLQTFAGLLERGERDAPDDQAARARADVEAKLAVAGGRVSGPMLRLLLRGSRAATRARENTKASTVIVGDFVRSLSQEAGRRLEAQGVLAAAPDVLLLTYDELRAALRGHPPADVKAVVAQRRADKERLDGEPEPPTLISGNEPLAVDLKHKTADELRGLGVCGGTVEGVARVVRDTAGLDDFVDGEILVAPFTDAGWTPYFAMAAAVIVETGGLLTHTSVVARELGLPAIVDVTDATRLIATGDRLRVNAGQGTIDVLERGAA